MQAVARMIVPAKAPVLALTALTVPYSEFVVSKIWMIELHAIINVVMKDS
jgi:hypothetical protein